jgi:hypothetical protein
MCAQSASPGSGGNSSAKASSVTTCPVGSCHGWPLSMYHRGIEALKRSMRVQTSRLRVLVGSGLVTIARSSAAIASTIARVAALYSARCRSA